jgi:dihydrofolate reductase
VRKIIAYVAISADGYIARPDGDVKWLDRPGARREPARQEGRRR